MNIKRLKTKISANPRRVVLQFFNVGSIERIKNVLQRINLLHEDEITKKLNDIKKNYRDRHLYFEEILLYNFSRVEKFLKDKKNITLERKLFIGSYFSKEYSIEAVSLFNPSIVPHPDQSLLKPGIMRFTLSLRATGEGHISSIEFKSGIIDEHNEIYFDSETRYATLPRKDINRIFTKKYLSDKLNRIDEKILLMLPESFTAAQLQKVIEKINQDKFSQNSDQISKILDVIDSDYTIDFPNETQLSERVIFPESKSESHGMEDVRFVKFINEDETFIYLGTYTAYNGFSFRTQMIETKDFQNFKIHSLHGPALQDKGMALFPRKINGKYAMISRQGGENLQIMFSDNLFYWDKYELLQQPEELWQYVQLGNCGSPIETEKGWLLLIHAVGEFRKYSIGAMLLDLDNPSKVIGSLKTPLLEPNDDEREGNVPNVLYSCGSLVHNGNLIIPYAMSDSATGFAKVNLKELLFELINYK
jgi:predicted GH43/DUF377 family glycosyl hydrolase